MKKVLFFTLCLLSVNLYSQRLNSDGLKMVSRLRVNGTKNYEVEFLYKDYYLNKLIFTYTEKHRNLDKTSYNVVYKDVLTRKDNTINQKSYLNNEPYNEYEYKYQFNDDSKLVHFDVYQYAPMEKIFRCTNDFIYINDTIYEIQKYSSWIEDEKWCYDPGIDVDFIEYRENIWNLIWKYRNLSNEQREKYAPLYTEDEFIESKDNLEEMNYGYIRTFEYSNIRNDVNISLNGLFEIKKMHMSNNGSSLTNILYFTEWVGIREAYLATKLSKGRKVYDITYKYDTKGNIIEVNYGNKMKIRIEYVPE